jgi:hypothetical protein
VRLDVPAGRAPIEQPMTDEQRVATGGVEHPRRRANVTSNDRLAEITAIVEIGQNEIGQQLNRDIISRKAAFNF